MNQFGDAVLQASINDILCATDVDSRERFGVAPRCGEGSDVINKIAIAAEFADSKTVSQISSFECRTIWRERHSIGIATAGDHVVTGSGQRERKMSTRQSRTRLSPEYDDEPDCWP